MSYFVTGNQYKFKEAQSIIPDLQQINKELTEIQGSPSEIVSAKLVQAHKIVNGLKLHQFPNSIVWRTMFYDHLIVEDVSLEFQALNGLPGPYVRHFVEGCGNDGLVRMLAGFEDKSARAVCMVGYFNYSHGEQYFQGVTEGHIVPPRGSGLFGWDAIFCPLGSTKTFAEMTPEEKNMFSPRKKAFTLLKEWMEQ